MLFGERSCGTLCNYHEEHPYRSLGHVSLSPAAYCFMRHGPTCGRLRLGGVHYAYELPQKVE
jgi:hypothetical protein